MNNGKYGEQLFKRTMENRNYKVKDVSNDPSYWNRDIDFIISSPTTGAVKTFEVKWDNRICKTGNLYLELSNVHSKDGIGWFNFCEADYIAYGDAVKRKFYIIPLLELKEKIKQVPVNYAQCGCDSIGLLVSLDSIKDIVEEL